MSGHMNPEGFDEAAFLTASSFEGAEVPDNLLNMEESEPDFTPEIKVEGHNLEASAPTRKASIEETAAEIEDTFAGLLSEGRNQDIAALSGELPPEHSNIDLATIHEFANLYRAALEYNPALKWYGKLARILKPDQFSCDEGNLTLSISGQTYRKILARFINDFPARLSAESPIVSCVRHIAAAARNEDQSASSMRRMDTKGSKRAESTDLNVGGLDFAGSEYNAFEGPGGFSDPEDDGFKPTASLKISLLDLSNKVIAEMLDAQKLTTAAIEDRLGNEGFSNQRINEIAGIVKYARIAREHLRTGR